MLALQIPPTEVQQRISEKYDVSTRCVRNDIQRVHRTWEAESSLERPARRGQLRSTLRRILQLALKKSDLRSAVGVCDRLAKLDGLNEALQVEHSGGLDHKITMSEEEIDSRIAQLSEAMRDEVH